MSISLAASAAIAGGIAAASAGGSAIAQGKLNKKNREWQEKMYAQRLKDQREDATLQYNRQKELYDWEYNNYTSPAAQRAAQRAAGLNPFVGESAIQPGFASASQPATGNSAPDAGTPVTGNPMVQAQPGLASAAGSLLQAQSLQADVDLKNAQKLKTLAEAKGLDNTNSLFDIVRASVESDLVSKRFRNALEEVQVRFAEANAITDQAQKSAKVAEIWASVEEKLAAAAKTDADRVTVDYLREAQKRSLESGSNLSDAQTQTEGAKQANLNAQTKSENDLRELNAALLRAKEKHEISSRDLDNAQETLTFYKGLGVLSDNEIKKAEAAIAELRSAVITGKSSQNRNPEFWASLDYLIGVISPLKLKFGSK